MTNTCPRRLHVVLLSRTLTLVLTMLWPHLAEGLDTQTDKVWTAASEGRAIWVFLRDKGAHEGTGQAAVSARAIRRLVLRGGGSPGVADLPVSSEYLDLLSRAGLDIRAVSRWLNAVAVTTDPSLLTRLSSMDIVDSIIPVAVFRRPVVPQSAIPPLPRSGDARSGTTLDYGLSQAQIRAIEADRLHEIGLDGRGVMIGMLDTGFDIAHPAFSSTEIVATRDFLNGDEDVGDGDLVQMAHGTAVLSVCGGFLPGELIGAAPGAQYALAKTEFALDEIEIEESYWIAGLEWADSLGCDIVSSSLGYTDWYTYSDLDGNTAPATIAADMAAARGVLVVTAAGNEGNKEWRYVIVPADGDSVLAVGASTIDGARAAFSSLGPTADGRIKPDIMAPGVQVWSANPGGGSYSFKNGTSFSTPLMAGVCALLLQDKPGMTPFEIIQRLRETATQATNPDNEMGYGIVRAARAAGLEGRFFSKGYQVWPNPTHDGFIRIVSPDSAQDHRTDYRILTVDGQPVYSGQFFGPAGFWRGVNERGGEVVSGVYLLWLKSSRGTETLKIAVVRGGS